MIDEIISTGPPMERSRNMQNPYASPATFSDARQADWYLASACRYFKWIGWVVIVYMSCASSIALYELFIDELPLVGAIIGGATMMAATLLFFGTMIRTAMRLPDDFERLYKRARWLGILAGAFGFPILTVPAFIGVSRLSKYRAMTKRC